MKSFTLALLCLSSFAYSSIKLDLDLYNTRNGEETQIKTSLDTALNKLNSFKIPNSRKSVEFTISKNMPKGTRINKNSKDTVLIDMKLFEEIDGEKKLISSPQIITRLNSEASLEEYDVDASTEKPVLKLKVNPKKIK